MHTRPVTNAPLPGPGDEVTVEIAADQPGVVRLVGTSYPEQVDLLWAIGPMAVCALLAVGRRRFAGQARRRAEEVAPAFAVVGRLPAPAGRAGSACSTCTRSTPPRRPAAGLGPAGLDRRAPARGAVPAPSARACRGPTGSSSPEPAARCCGRRPRRWVGDPVPGRRHRRPGGSAAAHDPPSSVRVRSLRGRPGLWAAPAAIVFVVLVAIVGWHGVTTDQERLDTWDHHPATVVDGSASDCQADVRFTVDGIDARRSWPSGAATTSLKGRVSR